MEQIVVQEAIENRIFVIRGLKVMLSTHLAGLYGVETKVLVQAVKRNLDRFPDDFMFQLSPKELAVLRAPNLTSKEKNGSGGGGPPPPPFS